MESVYSFGMCTLCLSNTIIVLRAMVLPALKHGLMHPFSCQLLLISERSDGLGDNDIFEAPSDVPSH